MKSKSDPRHLERVALMQRLFSFSFSQIADEVDLVREIENNREEIDALIIKAAPEWPLDQINKVDLAILRLSIFELKHKSAPHKVVIDEAVELAKEYGSENSPKFVNGVLGTVFKEINHD